MTSSPGRCHISPDRSILRRILSMLIAGLLVSFQTVAQEVVFSHPSGRYTDTFQLSLSVASPTATNTENLQIRYTLNGAIPTATTHRYSTSIPIAACSFPTSDIFRIQNSPDTLWYPPDSVQHIVVVRAALFDSNGTCRSAVCNHAYVVNSLLHQQISLPVVSLCIDSSDLFDYDSGIFVPGRHFDTNNPYHSGNYSLHGREWERRAAFAFLSDDGTAYEQICGIRIHGNRSRSFMQKGFTLYAREEYGAKQFSFPFFGPSAPPRYKRLVLRPWQSSWSGLGIEDWLCHLIAHNLRCDRLATRPVALFLNGEYWGIYFLQERPDEHYVAVHYGVDVSRVNMLLNWGTEVEHGSSDDWEAIRQWLSDADLSDNANYNMLSTQIDVGELMDYLLLQLFVSNVDWPANNTLQWSSPDYRWRWIFFDGDAAFGKWRRDKEMLELLTCDDSTQSYPSSPYSTLLIRRLLDSHNFKAHLIERFYHLTDDAFAYNRTGALLDSIEQMLADEVPMQRLRFPSVETPTNWHNGLAYIDRYLRSRPTSMPSHLASHLGVSMNDARVMLAPNPSHGAATLRYTTEWGGRLHVQIISTKGATVWKKCFELSIGTNEIALPSLPRGVYVVTTDIPRRASRWVVL